MENIMHSWNNPHVLDYNYFVFLFCKWVTLVMFIGCFKSHQQIETLVIKPIPMIIIIKLQKNLSKAQMFHKFELKIFTKPCTFKEDFKTIKP